MLIMMSNPMCRITHIEEKKERTIIMNTRALSLVGLATLGLAMVPVTAFADTPTSLNSNAQISFQLDNTQKPPLDPTEPNNDDGSLNTISPNDTVTRNTPNAGTGGPLSLDFVSSFNFGLQDISSVTKKYTASAQQYTKQNDDTSGTGTGTGPNFAQVTDVRSGSAKGWKLTVRMANDFKTKDGSTLDGAVISINNGRAVYGNDFKNTINTISSVNSTIQLSKDDSIVMGAKANEGYGTWLYTMGTKGTAGSSVTLTVPGSSPKSDEAYKTQLVWTLSDTAVE